MSANTQPGPVPFTSEDYAARMRRVVADARGGAGRGARHARP